MNKQRLQQNQQLKLSPKQIQFLGLLQIPLTSLESRIEQELEKNPENISVQDKTCLCTQFRKFKIWTCGHYVYRLKDTTHILEDGKYQLLSAEEVFQDYQFSKDQNIKLPDRIKSADSKTFLAAA